MSNVAEGDQCVAKSSVSFFHRHLEIAHYIHQILISNNYNYAVTYSVDNHVMHFYLIKKDNLYLFTEIEQINIVHSVKNATGLGGTMKKPLNLSRIFRGIKVEQKITPSLPVLEQYQLDNLYRTATAVAQGQSTASTAIQP